MSETAAPAEPLNFQSEFSQLIAQAESLVPSLTEALRQATEPGLASWWFSALLVLGIGVLAERLMCWKLGGLNRKLTSSTASSWSSIVAYGGLRLLFDAIGVLIFYAVAWLVLRLLIDSAQPVYATLEHALVAILRFRVCLIIARAILAPRAEGIRPLPIKTRDALTLFRTVMVFAGVYIGLNFLWASVFILMQPSVLGRATGITMGLGLAGVLIAGAWINRQRLEELFRPASAQDSAPSNLQAVFLQSWPYLFTAWVGLLWMNWGFSVFTQDAQRESSALVSWWITLLFPAADRLFWVLLNKLVRLPFLERIGFEHRRERFVWAVQLFLRVILVSVAVIAMALNWNLLGNDIVNSELGERVIWGAVEIGLIGLCAYIVYELVMSMLTVHMPEDEDGDNAEIEGEGGGSGATREETLAPLLRTVFVIGLGIIVVLTVLSSLGVQILPLIAGASIVGVAIGFGSQKLVQDVISGVFFLVDDAFRRGEYVDIGSVKGTVEKISVRSMQLRHHMGALHTIPFGEVRHLTNYSRDWVMMKLKLRLTYDTDVEKVRKLIKNLGKEMMADPEIGEKFLQPLKSQGVYSMEDDSAMIVRVKFMTRPGDQFVVRKTVYAAIRELFEREGVEFAHRVVKVQLDGKEVEGLSQEDRQRVAAAALNPSQTAG